MCIFSPQHAVSKITSFLRNVHFFASGEFIFLLQQARSKITFFLRNVRFFAAIFRFHPPQKKLKNHNFSLPDGRSLRTAPPLLSSDYHNTPPSARQGPPSMHSSVPFWPKSLQGAHSELPHHNIYGKDAHVKLPRPYCLASIIPSRAHFPSQKINCFFI